MKLEDQHRDPALLNDEMERTFSEHFLVNLKGPPPFIRLESEGFVKPTNLYCTDFCCEECTSMANGVLICSK